MLTEITDGIKLISDTIGNVKDIYEAVKDGYQYFNTKHPEIKKDVSAMCVELYKTCNAVATASGIITHFRFNGSPAAIDNEPTRFNQHFIGYKTGSQQAQDLIRSLKGSCHTIRQHAENLRQEAESTGFKNGFLSLFGLYSEERAYNLQLALENVYNEEHEWYLVVGRLSESITLAVQDVSLALETDGLMLSSNVPAASKLLNEYATAFGELELKAGRQADEIQAMVDELNR